MTARRTQRVKVDFMPGASWALVREIAGADEEWLFGRGTALAIELLDRLLVAQPGALVVKPGDAARLTAADRDQILAAVYVATFGPRVSGTQTCFECKKPFDLDFEVPSLADSRRKQSETLDCIEGVYVLPSGVRFRLPTGVDELAVAELPVEDAERALVERCLVEGDARRDGEQVAQAMGRIAPTLDLDLDSK